MEKRLILAIALSILVIVSFQHYVSRMYPQQPRVAGQGLMQQNGQAEDTSAQHVVVEDAKKESVQAASLAAKYPNEEEYVVETDRLVVVFSNIGGSIKEIRLKDYLSDDKKSYLAIATCKDPRQYIMSISDPTNLIPSLNELPYTLSENKGRISYSIKTENVEVEKTYALSRTDCLIESNIKVKNVGTQPITMSYRLLGGSGMIEPPKDRRFYEVLAKINGKIDRSKDPKGARIINKGIVEWTALKTRYFSLILKPLSGATYQYCEGSMSEGLRTGVDVQGFTLDQRAMIENQSVLFAGPSDIKQLKEYNLGLEETVTFGIFTPISKVLLVILNLLYRVFHNWGVSIIILALILNTITFPLTRKSFQSMQKMQSLQPHMEKLKTQHKNSPQKLNKEMMGLYKEHKVNPLGGCLPMLLQMPIFISLYQALIRSINLKGASFLWIKDLSLPDAFPLPFELPVLGNSINILPILMAGAMLMQQKISGKAMAASQSKEQAQQQKMMMIMMPVMFGVIFYSFSSGLVLYWLTNTMLTVTEQTLIFKKKQA